MHTCQEIMQTHAIEPVGLSFLSLQLIFRVRAKFNAFMRQTYLDVKAHSVLPQSPPSSPSTSHHSYLHSIVVLFHTSTVALIRFHDAGGFVPISRARCFGSGHCSIASSALDVERRNHLGISSVMSRCCADV